MKGEGRKEFYAELGGSRRHVFKVLCPEPLVTSIMGPRGSTKDQIQEETGCKLVFGNHDDFFPGTRFRTLCIYADEAEGILPVLERVVDRLLECAEHEMSNVQPKKKEANFIGKEPGEVMLRGLISSKMFGAVIGPKGSTVKAIREQNTAKVSIENKNFGGHFMMRVIAPPEGLRTALVMINECIQSEVSGEEFSEWAAVRSFDPAMAMGHEEKGSGKTRTKHAGKAGKGKGGKAGKKQGWPEPRSRERSPRRKGGKNGEDKARADNDAHDLLQTLPPESNWEEEGDGQDGNWADGEVVLSEEDALQKLTETAQEFPDGTLPVDYTLTCALPSDKVPYLQGQDDENIIGIGATTGARLHFEEMQEFGEGQQNLVIQGPLLRVYKAHLLMMKSYHESELPEPSQEEQSVENLQEQLAELQNQLAAVQAQQGKGKGKKG